MSVPMFPPPCPPRVLAPSRAVARPPSSRGSGCEPLGGHVLLHSRQHGLRGLWADPRAQHCRLVAAPLGPSLHVRGTRSRGAGAECLGRASDGGARSARCARLQHDCAGQRHRDVGQRARPRRRLPRHATSSAVSAASAAPSSPSASSASSSLDSSSSTAVASSPPHQHLEAEWRSPRRAADWGDRPAVG